MENNVFNNKKTQLNIVYVVTFIILILIISMTYAWYSGKDYRENVAIFGNLDLEVTTDLNFENVILEPNKTYNKTTTIKSKENSTDAYIKVVFECDAKVGNTDENIVEPILYVDQDKQSNGEQTWIKNGNSYFYVGYINQNISAIFNTGFIVSNNLSNEDCNKPVNLKITVYAIQRAYGAYKEHSDWVDAPEEWKNAIAKYDIV